MDERDKMERRKSLRDYGRGSLQDVRYTFRTLSRDLEALIAYGEAAVAYVAEMKIDGLSIALTYEDGRLIRGATRGDGARGEDVTINVRTIRAVPLSLRDGPPGRIEVRGEVYLSRAAFERINRDREEAGEELYANPRNSAAGTMRNLEPGLVAKRGLGASRARSCFRVRRRQATRRPSKSSASFTMWLR
jgi:NAD-dependent DNA ligase